MRARKIVAALPRNSRDDETERVVPERHHHQNHESQKHAHLDGSIGDGHVETMTLKTVAYPPPRPTPTRMNDHLCQESMTIETRIPQLSRYPRAAVELELGIARLRLTRLAVKSEHMQVHRSRSKLEVLIYGYRK